MQSRFYFYLYRLDRWAIDRATDLMLWLRDRWGISERTVHKFLVILYVICGMWQPVYEYRNPFTSGAILLVWIATCACGYLLWHLRRYPKTLLRLFDYRIRVLASCIMTTSAIALFDSNLYVRHPWLSSPRILNPILFIIYEYVVIAETDIHPPRHEKFSLAELKKMFGTDWIPRPQPIPTAKPLLPLTW